MLGINRSKYFIFIKEDHHVIAGKLESRSAKTIFLGYKSDYNYIIWLLNRSRFLYTLDLIFISLPVIPQTYRIQSDHSLDTFRNNSIYDVFHALWYIIQT